MSQLEWATDLFAAADELGYDVIEVTPKSVTLNTGKHIEITITSYITSGSLLREMLRPSKSAPLTEGTATIEPRPATYARSEA